MNTAQYFEHIGHFIDGNNYVCVDDYLLMRQLDQYSIQKMKEWITSRFTKKEQPQSNAYLEQLIVGVEKYKKTYTAYFEQREERRLQISGNNNKQRELLAIYSEKRQEYAILSNEMSEDERAIEQLKAYVKDDFERELEQRLSIDEQMGKIDVVAVRKRIEKWRQKVELSRKRKASLNRKINALSKNIRNLKTKMIEMDKALNEFERTHQQIVQTYTNQINKLFQFIAFRTIEYDGKLYMYNALVYELQFLNSQEKFNEMLLQHHRTRTQYDHKILPTQLDEGALKSYKREADWVLKHLGEFESSHSIRKILDIDDGQSDLFVKLQYLSAFYTALFDESRQYEPDKMNEYQFMYRGHSDSNFRLTPSIYREQKWIESEHKMYRDIHIKCSDELSQFNTALEVLASMQHYSLPTRLLDITNSPLIALFFATEVEPSLDGEFLVFAEEDKGVSYYDSDKADVLSTLPLLTYTEKNRLKVHAIKCILTNMNQVIEDSLREENNQNRRSIIAIRDTMLEQFNQHETVKKLLHEMSKNGSMFTSKIDPMDILDVLVVRPVQNNTRIARQHGAFIINGLLEKWECERKIEEIRYRKRQENKDVQFILQFLAAHEETLEPKLLALFDVFVQEVRNGLRPRYIIPSKAKSALQEWLDVIEINESTIYPDYERVASYLKKYVLSK